MFKTNFDVVFNFHFNSTFSLDSNLMKNKQTKKKSRKIVSPKLVTSLYFQKGLNPQIVENKEIQRNKYKNCRVKLMWVFGFYMWHLSLTTTLFEFIKCNMVIFKNYNFLRTMKSGFRHGAYNRLHDLGPFGNTLFICRYVKVECV